MNYLSLFKHMLYLQIALDTYIVDANHRVLTKIEEDNLVLLNDLKQKLDEMVKNGII